MLFQEERIYHTKKRTINNQLVTIRQLARQKNAEAIPGKYGKWARQKIHQEKENALLLYENQKCPLRHRLLIATIS